MKWLIRDGSLTWIAELILGAIVLISFFGIPIFNLPIWMAIPVGVIAAIAAAVLMFEGRATALGLKPFTNDPLGWRKAKESYKAETQDKQEGADKQ